MRIFIEPGESLMFRTGRPFEAGESNFAESLFPPTPETLQGALRAAIATHWDPDLNKAFAKPELTALIGDRTSYGCFRITSITLGRYGTSTPVSIERLFPSPSHILCDEQGKLRLQPELKKNVQSNLPTGITHLLVPERETAGKLRQLGGWLTETSLFEALRANGDGTKLEKISTNEIYQHEPRMGIGMQNSTKSTRDGFLYQSLMIRMQPHYGFVVDIRLSTTPANHRLQDDAQTQTALKLPDEGWLTLGGEQRAARYRIVPSPTENNEKLSRTGRLLYIATPAYFTEGWRPSRNFDPFDKPIAAAVGRPELIGGWKLNPGDAKGDQKSARRCVPPGSVYFFEQSVTVPGPLTEYGQEIGYGIAYTGEW